MQKEVIVYRGIKFTRYPEAKAVGARNYFKGFANGKHIKLHVYKWQCEKGEIPAKHHIHHKDGNSTNNEIDNLECLSAKKHLQHHYENKTEEQKKRLKENLITKAIPASKEWHRSSEGRAWHREHAAKTFFGEPTRL